VIAIAPAAKSDFFSGDRVLLRGKWLPLKRHGFARTVISGIVNIVYDTLSLRERPMHLLQQYRAAQLAGLKKFYLEAPHTPHPVNTKTLGDFFSETKNQKKLNKNIKHRFRHMSQFVAHPLANYLEIVKGNYEHLPNEDYLTIVFNEQDRITPRLQVSLLRSGNYKFLCLQNLERAEEDTRLAIEDLLDNVILRNQP
jgi:hypothetical protein